LFALEHGDVDRAAAVVQIRRAYANGRVKHTKTRLSRRAVPLQAIAVEALDKLRSRRDSLLVFPNARGGYLDFRNFNRHHWKPCRKQPGSSHCANSTTCATPTIPSHSPPGVPVFALSRIRASRSSISTTAMSRQPCALRLAPRCARARAGGERWVDVELEARKTGQRLGFQASRKAFAVGGGRAADVEVRSHHHQRCQKG